MGEHIERMKVELKELQEKIGKLENFLNKEREQKQFTNEDQRFLLGMQLTYMQRYKDILEARIEYDTKKNEVKNDK